MTLLFTGLVVASALAAAVPAIGTAAGGAKGNHTKLSGLDEEWTTAALQGDLFEIKGGKLAQKQAQSEAVKQLGQRLTTDHSEAYAKGSHLAKSLHIEVPTEPTYPEKWELQTVGAMSGAAFDQAYTSLEQLDHMQDIEDAKTEIEDGTNKMVIALAKTDLKMYREHLALVKKTEKEM
jgi:predicted outer membrane protein